MGMITAADAVLTLQIATLFPTPVQLQGFGVDDVYSLPSVRSAEVMMGVDGKLSAGFVFTPITQGLTLQADSQSNDVFDEWWTRQQANKTLYPAQGLIILPAIGKKYQQVEGFLTGYPPGPSAGRVLRARQFEITWQSILPQPA